jgi:hypothetical protein
MTNKKTKILSINIGVDFPLSGKELKKVLVNIHVFPLAVNEPKKYAIWVETNAIISEYITKLIDWSEKQNVATTA